MGKHYRCMVLLSPSYSADILLDTVPSAVKNVCRGAFSLRLLSQGYLGAVVNVRNGTTGATQDFYADPLGNLGNRLGAAGTTLDEFLSGATGFVTTWYDQSGSVMHASQPTAANQPSMLKTSIGWCVQFNGSTQSMSYGSGGINSIWYDTNYTLCAKEQRTSSHGSNIFQGSSSTVINANLSVGYDNTTLFRYSQYGNELDFTIPAYTGAATSEPVRRWMVSAHRTASPGKHIHLNGTQVLTKNDNVLLNANIGQSTIGRNVSWYYAGRMYELLMFVDSLPVAFPASIPVIDASLAAAGRGQFVRLSTTTTRTATSVADPTGFAGIPPSVLQNCVGAYSVRRLFPSYTGPSFLLRRDNDNADAFVWTDYNGNVVRVVNSTLDDEATTGGTVTYSSGYRIHTFTGNGTFGVTQPRACDLLIVAGGASGGVRHGGGGGAGGVVFKSNLWVNSSNLVVVGGGGAGIPGTVASQGNNGNNSSFGSLISVGGGAGSAANGANGGGTNGAGALRTMGIPGQGNAGGITPSSGAANQYGGGGGGGAGSQGADTLIVTNKATAGNGGIGRAFDINGTLNFYAGGGGGGCSSDANSAGTGGTGGGGAGSLGAITATNGTINSGGGGGGSGFTASTSTNGASGSGGSGVVIVRTLRHPGVSSISEWLGASTGTLVGWYDQSGKLNHATTIRGNPRVSVAPSEPYLYGNTGAGIRFPVAILPTTYTLFHVARYGGTTRARIFDGVAQNWLSGFGDGKSGVAYHDALITQFNNDVHGTFSVVSTDQNKPNMYRANGINRTTQNPIIDSTNKQLSINHGATAEYSDWIVKDVLVFNATLPLQNIINIERRLMAMQLGMLDQIGTPSGLGTQAAFALRLLTFTYTGPVVTLRNGTTGVVQDFYASVWGDLGTTAFGTGTSVREWLKGATGYVTKWWDQTGRGYHVVQATLSLQPSLQMSNRTGNGLRFQTQNLSCGNPFSTSQVSNMQLIFVSRENATGENLLISLNGTNNSDNATDGTGRFSMHAPWTNGHWYWDSGNVSANRAQTYNGRFLSVGKRAVFNGYKSSTKGFNGFRINGGSWNQSAGYTPAYVSGGLLVGFLVPDHTIYGILLFESNLSSGTETLLEGRMAALCPP